MLHTKVSLIALAIASQSSFLFAQEQNIDEIEEVVAIASPIKDSQLAAIEAKRVASNVMEVIAADTIGTFSFIFLEKFVLRSVSFGNNSEYCGVRSTSSKVSICFSSLLFAIWV